MSVHLSQGLVERCHEQLSGMCITTRHKTFRFLKRSTLAEDSCVPEAAGLASRPSVSYK